MTKFSVLTPVPQILCVHHVLSEAALQQIPIKSEVVFLNSHFSAALSALQRATETRSDKKTGTMLSVHANQENYPGWIGLFLQGHGIEKQYGLCGISGVFVP